MMQVNYNTLYDKMIYELNMEIIKNYFPICDIIPGNQLKKKNYYMYFYSDDSYSALYDDTYSYTVGYNKTDNLDIEIFSKNKLKCKGVYISKVIVPDNAIVKITPEKRIFVSEIIICNPELCNKNKFFI